MKAPSPLCLRVLRSLAFPSPQQSCVTATARRYYAALSSQPAPAQTQPRQIVPPPPPPPVFRPPPSGSDLRKKRDNDEDFTPYPLTRPIGLPTPPQPGENTGLDHRSLRQRRDDFHSYQKHLERRAKMTKQIAKPYFRDWSNMRFHKGKVFVAPERLFRSEVALWFPNFFGKTLEKAAGRRKRRRSHGRTDGYGGLGRDTCEVMQGKVSVVSIVSNVWAEAQVGTFCSRKENPALYEVLEQNEDVAQRVEINLENNFLKWWLLQTFAGNLRRTRTVEEQGRYFMVRRGVSDIMKEGIGLLNDKGGYVYLVDGECKIRWAGSAEATEKERESLVRGLRRLIREARTPKEERIDYTAEKERLESVVAEVVAEEPKKAAAAG